MSIVDAKNLIKEKLGWDDIFYLFYLTTDRDQFLYYLVYKNHCIKCVAVIDSLNRRVSNIWK